jgi:hypothetical protein
VWRYGEDEESGKGRWVVSARHYFAQKAKVNSVAYHRSTNLIVVGFSNGCAVLPSSLKTVTEAMI